MSRRGFLLTAHGSLLTARPATVAPVPPPRRPEAGMPSLSRERRTTSRRPVAASSECWPPMLEEDFRRLPDLPAAAAPSYGRRTGLSPPPRIDPQPRRPLLQ